MAFLKVKLVDINFFYQPHTPFFPFKWTTHISTNFDFQRERDLRKKIRLEFVIFIWEIWDQKNGITKKFVWDINQGSTDIWLTVENKLQAVVIDYT